MFLAGLMDWVGDALPDSESIAGCSVLDNGFAHIKTIHVTGGEILGVRDLSIDGIRGLQKVSHRGGRTVYVYEGATRLRPASDTEAAEWPILGVWGYRMIALRAEKAFLTK